MIITKSLSRFARNTVDTLNTIRKLKVAGIGVYFEKEDIDTLDAKGEFLITLMSSLAEEESSSISENVKWGVRKRFADGKYSLPYKQFLGYNKGIEGNPVLVESEARIIRLIYRYFTTDVQTVKSGTRKSTLSPFLRRTHSQHHPAFRYSGRLWSTTTEKVAITTKYQQNLVFHRSMCFILGNFMIF